MFDTILVPLDGSALSERAVSPAISVARLEGGKIILLRVPVLESMLVPAPEVIGGYGLVWPDEALEHSRQESSEYLSKLLERLQGEGVPVITRLEEGDPAALILDLAEAECIDLICMSTHGHSGITRWVLGSVSEKVIRSAPCPVFLARHEKRIRKVLIPVDGSALSESAIRPAIRLARSLRAEATLIHAVGIGSREDRRMQQLEELEAGLGSRLLETIDEEAHRYLQRLVDSLEPAEVPLNSVVVDQPAAESILHYAETNDFGLVAMATHGRSGIRRWVYGSVTEKVMRGGCCSMLIVPP